MTDQTEITCSYESNEKDAAADAIAAVTLIVLFMAICLFWISGQ